MKLKQTLRSSVKRTVSSLIVLLILGGSGLLIHTYLLGVNILQLSGFQQFIHLVVVCMLTFLIVEMNRSMPAKGIAIGLILGISFTLPYLLQFSTEELSFSKFVIVGVAQIIVITLASHTFESMWDAERFDTSEN